jgi:hypothetical protein
MIKSLKDIKAAISQFISDKSRSSRETQDGLEELADDIEMYIDAIKQDRGEQ